MTTYNPLHLKYRPQTLAQLVGQEAISTTLTNALTHERIAPAYLFTGQRGTGKTSTARILSKSLNCLKSDAPTPHPCGHCDSCKTITNGSALDVIEIDAASNNSVDNIRELLEKAQYRPVTGRYKVFIIDECHALSSSAIQALLKTLESPPPRVVFLLCTTEPQKLGDTIISRCQRYHFHNLTLAALVKHLEEVSTQEKIDITEEALKLIAHHANGGVRDSLTLLDQARLLTQTITAKHISELVGTVDEEILLSLLKAILEDNTASLIETVRQLHFKQPVTILNNLIEFYTNLILARSNASSSLGTVSSSMWRSLQELSLSPQQALSQQQYLRSSETQVKFSRTPYRMLEAVMLGLLTKPLEPTTPTRLKTIDKAQLWQEVIAQSQSHIRPILAQHTNLVSIEGESVKIAVSSPPLKQHLTKYIPLLERTFKRLLNDSVNVSLI